MNVAEWILVVFLSVALLIFLILGIVLLLHGNDDVAVRDRDVEILLGHSRGSNLNLVALIVLRDVDGRRGAVELWRYPTIVEEVVEQRREESLITCFSINW